MPEVCFRGKGSAVGAFNARHGQFCACLGPFLPQIYLSKVHTQKTRKARKRCEVFSLHFATFVLFAVKNPSLKAPDFCADD